MNFVFISPNFPETYYRFCQALRNNGVRVLGIGDVPEANISNELRSSLDAYYYVHDLNNLEEKKKALYTVQVGAFSSKNNAIKYAEKIRKAGLDAIVVSK